MHLSFHQHTKVFSNKERDSFRHRLFDNPYTDWLVIICASVILVGVCVGVGVLKYYSVQEKLNAPSTEMIPDRVASFDVETLSRILRQFDDRSAERSNLLKGYTGVSDPSL